MLSRGIQRVKIWLQTWFSFEQGRKIRFRGKQKKPGEHRELDCEQQNVLKTRKYGCLWIDKLPHTTSTAEAIPSLHLCDSHPLHTCLVAALLLYVSSQAAAHKGYNPNSSTAFHQRTLLCCKRFSGFIFNQFFCVVFLSLLQLGLGLKLRNL